MFCMMQCEEETMEDYLEWFLFSIQLASQNDLTNDTIKMLFLRGIHHDCMEILNLMGGGDISKVHFQEIF